MKMPLFAVSIFVALFACSDSAEAETRKPNVLVILADDLGYGELSVQGNPQIPTPHIDAIARNGVRFTNGYVSAPYCSPTRAGLLTGRYQQRFGYEFNPSGRERHSPGFGLPVGEKTIAQRLKDAGYRTALFGKWHLGYAPQHHPQRRGFDEFVGFLGGHQSYVDSSTVPDDPVVRGETPLRDFGYTTELFSREASGFIERHSGQPWFVFLSFNAVHTPMQATEARLARFAHIEDARRRAFAAMMSALDDAVGAVAETIRSRGLEQDTLIFFLSDNGGPTRTNTARNDPLRGYKSQLAEGGIRVPFMLQWKGRLPAGRVFDHPVIQLDVAATALAAAEIEIEPEWQLDGVDLLPFLRGARKGAPHKALHWRLGPQMAVRMGDWKLVKAHGMGTTFSEQRVRTTADGARLFHLTRDPSELHDESANQPEIVAKLASAWNEWNSRLAEPRWFPGRVGDVEARRP